MCFVAIVFQVHPRFPVVVAANRNESRARPATAPHRWAGDPPIWAGRDELAGGTWLGANGHGMLVAVTNRRDGPRNRARPSRGALCLDALRQPSPIAAQLLVEQRLRDHRYNPFNLLCASPTEGWVATWQGGLQPLVPGIHVLTNEGDLDDEQVHMIRRASEALAQISIARAPLDSLLDSLGRLCADTSEPDPICRPGGTTGTVSSSIIALGPDGSLRAYRHAEGPPSENPYVAIDLADLSF